MKIILYTIFILVLCIQTISCDDVLVQVQQGWLAGEQLKTVIGNTTYFSFKGIPYAKPPVGPLRFKEPQEPESWDGVRNATEHGSKCPQVNLITNTYLPGSEDCLFINIYTPCMTPDTPLPVMMYIHGGLYKFESGNTDTYGPDFIVMNNVVLVTFNYRLDALGFLCLDIKEVPGNAGLKDQLLALKWVKNNIKNFGGNPNNITLYGQSTGAVSVAYHLVSPQSKGLFQRAISQSGAISADTVMPYKPVDRAFTLGKVLGFETTDPYELLNFLQNVTYDKLINQTCAVLASETQTSIIFKEIAFPPVIEKDCGQNISFITKDPFTYLDSGDVNDVDVMFGYNSYESLIMIQFYVNWLYIERYNRYPEIFVPTKILKSSPPDVILDNAHKIIEHYFGNKTVSVDNMHEFTKYANAAYLTYDIHRFFRRWPKAKNIYFNKFSGYTSRNYYGLQGADYGIKGAAHYDDLLYLFDPKSMNMTLETNSTEYGIIQLITKVYTNFAKYGNPTPDSSLGVTWPQFDNETLAYVDINQNLTVGYAPDEDDVQFWKGILEGAGIKF